MYIISEEALIELVRDSLELAALNSGGVDNWEWAGESCSNYLDELASHYNLEREDLSFEDVAKVMVDKDMYGYFEPRIGYGGYGDD